MGLWPVLPSADRPGLLDRIRIWWAGEKAVWAASARFIQGMSEVERRRRERERKESPWEKIRQRARRDERARLEEMRSG